MSASMNAKCRHADAQEAVHEYGVSLAPWEALPRAHAVVLAVAHKALTARSVDDYVRKLEQGGLFVDVKCQADAAGLRERGIAVWRL